MAKPTANTEAGGAKVLILASTKSTTPDAANPASPIFSVSGDGTYGNIGWLAICTHGDGDGALAPGGGGASAPKDQAGTAKAPIVLLGGQDNAGTKLVHALRADENGVLLVRTEPALDLPLAGATAGGTTIGASTAETAISAIDAARFGYLQSLWAVCTVASSAAGTFTLRDGAAGTTLQLIQQAKTVTAVGDVLGPFPYANPLKTNAINKQFTIQASATTLGTWVWFCNGFRSTL